MSIGFGSLKQMNDTIRANREMLGKKRSVRDLYKEELNNIGSSAENQTLEQVRYRVAERLKQNQKKLIRERLLSVAIVIFCVGIIIWVMLLINREKAPYPVERELFTTVFYPLPNGMTLKADHYLTGPKAAETFLKDGLRHQNSESYYESGEQFRSALYYHDTLVTQVFFYKSGDTIENFPTVDESKMVKIRSVDKRKHLVVEFLIFDNKVISGSYKETQLIE